MGWVFGWYKGFGEFGPKNLWLSEISRDHGKASLRTFSSFVSKILGDFAQPKYVFISTHGRSRYGLNGSSIN